MEKFTLKDAFKGAYKETFEGKSSFGERVFEVFVDFPIRLFVYTSQALAGAIVDGLTPKKKQTNEKRMKKDGLTSRLSKMTVKSENEGGLLTQTFARPAKGKTPEERKAREEKATKLLKTLRERDANGKSVSVKNYKQQRKGR